MGSRTTATRLACSLASSSTFLRTAPSTPSSMYVTTARTTSGTTTKLARFTSTFSRDAVPRATAVSSVYW